MHPIAFFLGLFVFLVGLFLVFIGGVATIFTLAGFFAVSIGIMTAGFGAIVALIGWWF
jgi:hypothetical protein